FVGLEQPYSTLDLVILRPGRCVQLFCWTNQFIGHGVFEKRAPALLDNLAQVFLMAPFFVFLEVLQSLFKYEPCPGFSASVQAKRKADIKEWKKKKEKLS
ncbi:uncharacterized endoplasmic reticulum membrane protein C16E8.02-like, partial [Cucurbita maxima]|uniref:Uncharacterized endoplasmic reticulum membrane protein C16E8.02-like n=1 Tax=Cucurbita maxima TaxID=3661 RepID=A0A6J1JJ34_CUCMA